MNTKNTIKLDLLNIRTSFFVSFSAMEKETTYIYIY